MLELRRRQLKQHSQLDIPYILNNSENLPKPKDFEYDVAGYRLDVYKEINNKEVQLRIIWMPHELHRVFQVSALILNTEKSGCDYHSQDFNSSGLPIPKQSEYDERVYLPKYLYPLAKKAIPFYKKCFPSLNYLDI